MRDVGLRHLEAGVRHAQGIEDRGLEVVAELLARHDLDEPGADVGLEAVAPSGAGLVDERRLPDVVGERFEGDAPLGEDARASDTTLLCRRGLQREPDAGHVHHDVFDGRGAHGVDESLGPVGRCLLDLHAPPRGDEAVHGIGELEVSPLVEAHERNAGDRLGHRVDPPDGVVGDGGRTLEVGQAEMLVVADGTVPGDRDRASGDLAGLDVAAREVLVDASEAAGVEAGGLRVDLHVLVPPVVVDDELFDYRTKC